MESVVRHPARLAFGPLFRLALRALGRRALTESELERRLLARCADEEDVAAVLDRLREFGYIDDGLVAESHAFVRKELAMVGRKRVLGELKRRGVSAATARDAVKEIFEDSSETELAIEHLRRKLGGRFETWKGEDPKELARVFRALIRAGFAAEVVAEAIGSVAGGSERLEALADAAIAGGLDD